MSAPFRTTPAPSALQRAMAFESGIWRSLAGWLHTARIVAAVLGLWGRAWMVGMLGALTPHPHLVDDSGLRLRHGFGVDLRVPWDAIASVAGQSHDLLSSMRSVHAEKSEHGDVLAVRVSRRDLDAALIPGRCRAACPNVGGWGRPHDDGRIPMRRTRTVLATCLAAALLLSGCGSEDPAADETPSPSASATAEEPADDATEEPEQEPEKESEKPRPQGPFADLTFDGDSALPNGERIELGVGETLTLRIDSDRPGELHVHSTPEKEIAFPAGQSERKLTIEQPGVVDVEEHESGKVLLQLEVS